MPRLWKVVNEDIRCALVDVKLRTIALAVIDPPYNIGHPYTDHDDRMKAEAYRGWVKSWMCDIKPKLKDDASIYFFIPDEWVSEVDIMMKCDYGFTKRRDL